jgi:cis-3-alkyl-4-acyloxetan-2-one decarboxylase
MTELPPWLKVLYPFETASFASSEGHLSYVDEGAGPAVVMFHGNPTWSFFYRDLILQMRTDHRCLALDHLGCGLSDKPQRSGYHLSGHIDRAVAWLQSLSLDGFHLVVHDWGGAIGFGVAAQLRDQVKGITILNTAAFPFPSIPREIALCRIPLVGSLLVRGANAFVEGANRKTTVRPLSEAVASGYRWPYDNWRNRVAVHAFVKDVPMRPAHRSWNCLRTIEESLPFWNDRPVQIIWGMQDWCFHQGILSEWKRRLPQARVHSFKDASHYLLEDAGGQIIPLIRGFCGS